VTGIELIHALLANLHFGLFISFNAVLKVRKQHFNQRKFVLHAGKNTFLTFY